MTRSVVHRLVARGISVKGYFILGFPTETRAELAATVRHVYDLWRIAEAQPGSFRASVFEFRPYPGTPEWQRLLATGRYEPKQLLDYTAVDLTRGGLDEAMRGRDEFNFSVNIQFGEYRQRSARTANRTITGAIPAQRDGMNMHRGFFVAVDGPSGIGKSTLTGLLADRLTTYGWSVVATKEPTATPLGSLARFGTDDYHGLVLACLVAADRYQHLEHEIRPALQPGGSCSVTATSPHRSSCNAWTGYHRSSCGSSTSTPTGLTSASSSAVTPHAPANGPRSADCTAGSTVAARSSAWLRPRCTPRRQPS